jgi:hypothetical protein
MSVFARTLSPVPCYLPLLDRAVSDAADSLKTILRRAPATASVTDRRIESGEDTLREAVSIARGHGITISQIAVSVASALLEALPQHVPLPSIVVEEDGEIALDWNESSDRSLTVSIKENGDLGYSALVGLRPDYGRAPFAGSIPDTVLFNMLRVYPLPTGPRRAQ